MKPTNFPTQGQPDPRKNGLTLAFRSLFSTAFYFRGLGFILHRKQTTRNLTQPNSPQTKFSANTGLAVAVGCYGPLVAVAARCYGSLAATVRCYGPLVVAAIVCYVRSNLVVRCYGSLVVTVTYEG